MEVAAGGRLGTHSLGPSGRLPHSLTEIGISTILQREDRRSRFAGCSACASFVLVDVVLRKMGRRGGRVVAGRLVRAPRAGSVVVIEFPDGLHEYVTTPVKRVLRLVGGDVFFLQTANSCYRLEVRSGGEATIDSIAK